MQYKTLKELFTYDELVDFFQKNHDNINIITDYTNKTVTINPLGLQFNFSLTFDKAVKQIKMCNYTMFHNTAYAYRDSVWNKNNYFEKALGPHFAKAFGLFLAYQEELPTPDEFLKFYIDCALEEIAPQTYMFKKWCDWNRPERRNVILPPKKPFSYLDVMVRINNNYCGFVREIAAALDATQIYQKQDSSVLNRYQLKITHNVADDLYHDTDLSIHIVSNATNEKRQVSVSFFDNTERGVEKRLSKLQNNFNKHTAYDLKICIPTCLSRFNKLNPNTYDVAGVELYTEDTMKRLVFTSLSKNITGDYTLTPDFWLIRTHKLHVFS